MNVESLNLFLTKLSSYWYMTTAASLFVDQTKLPYSLFAPQETELERLWKKIPADQTPGTVR